MKWAVIQGVSGVQTFAAGEMICFSSILVLAAGLIRLVIWQARREEEGRRTEEKE